jgi:hypothetical protein
MSTIQEYCTSEQKQHGIRNFFSPIKLHKRHLYYLFMTQPAIISDLVPPRAQKSTMSLEAQRATHGPGGHQASNKFKF